MEYSIVFEENSHMHAYIFQLKLAICRNKDEWNKFFKALVLRPLNNSGI